MKKLLFSLALMLVAGVTGAWADDAVTTLFSNDYENADTYSTGWTGYLSDRWNTSQITMNNSKGLRIAGSDNGTTGTYSLTGISGYSDVDNYIFTIDFGMAAIKNTSSQTQQFSILDASDNVIIKFINTTVNSTANTSDNFFVNTSSTDEGDKAGTYTLAGSNSTAPTQIYRIKIVGTKKGTILTLTDLTANTSTNYTISATTLVKPAKLSYGTGKAYGSLFLDNLSLGIDISLYKSVYDAAKTKVDALNNTEISTAFTNATATDLAAYNARTMTDVASAIKTVKGALATAIITAGETDLTSVIYNPTFALGNTNGWDIPTIPATCNVEDKTQLLMIQGNPIYQNLGTLPAGTYTLTAKMSSLNDGSSIAAGYLMANDEHAQVLAVENWGYADASLTFTLSDAKDVKIGFVGAITDGNYTFSEDPANNLWWYRVKDFTLTYAGSETTYDVTFSETNSKAFTLYVYNEDGTAVSANEDKSYTLTKNTNYKYIAIPSDVKNDAVKYATFVPTSNSETFTFDDQSLPTFTLPENAISPKTTVANGNVCTAAINRTSATTTGIGAPITGYTTYGKGYTFHATFDVFRELPSSKTGMQITTASAATGTYFEFNDTKVKYNNRSDYDISSTPLTVGRWYRVNIECDLATTLSNNPGTMTMTITDLSDNTQFATKSDINFRNSSLGWLLPTGVTDCIITAYHTYFTANNSEETITTNANGVTSYVTTYALDFENVEGLTAYICPSFTSSTVNLTKATKVPAYTALVVKGAANTDYSVPAVVSADAVENKFEAADGTKTASALGSYVYCLNTAGQFQLVDGTVTIPEGKAYLASNIQLAKTLSLNFGDEATAINTVEAANTAAKAEGKFVKNGQLVIVKNGKQYNAAGAQVK